MSEANRSPLLSIASSNNLGAPATRWLHVFLLVVGLTGWMVFILACIGGPAWSPDGSKVLFAYRDVDNSRTAVALYDRTTGVVSTIFAQPTPKEGELGLHPAWQTDGTRALVGIYRNVPRGSSDGACELVSLPVKSSLPLQVYNLGDSMGCAYPYFQRNGKVYFGGVDLRWIDLVTGEVNSEKFKSTQKLEDDEPLILAEDGDRIFYERELRRRPSDDGSDETGIEVGRIALEDFSLTPSFTFWEQDLSQYGVEHADSGLGPHGSIVAMLGVGSEDSSDKILLAEENKGIVRALAPDLGIGSYKLGSLTWSHDGTVVYASTLSKGEMKNAWNYGMAEIPVDGSRARVRKIASLRREMSGDFESEFRMGMPVSLSPDERWIAATPAVLGKGTVEDRDRALFLIDLRDPTRRMKRVPIPRQPPTPTPAPTVEQ